MTQFLQFIIPIYAIGYLISSGTWWGKMTVYGDPFPFLGRFSTGLIFAYYAWELWK